MVSGSALEICFIVLFCVSLRCNYVETLPSTFLQDEQQQAEQQAEAISERFFDEVRQLLEQKISSEAAAAAELDITTTEPPPIGNADERYIETTISPIINEKVKDNLPAVMPPKPTQVRRIDLIQAIHATKFISYLSNCFSLYSIIRWLIGQNLIYAWGKWSLFRLVLTAIL